MPFFKKKKEEEGPKAPESEGGVKVIPAEFFEVKEGENPHMKMAQFAGIIAQEMIRLNLMVDYLIRVEHGQQEPEEVEEEEPVTEADIKEFRAWAKKQKKTGNVN